MRVEMADSAVLIIIFLEGGCYYSDSCVLEFKILYGLAFDDSV